MCKKFSISSGGSNGTGLLAAILGFCSVKYNCKILLWVSTFCARKISTMEKNYQIATISNFFVVIFILLTIVCMFCVFFGTCRRAGSCQSSKTTFFNSKLYGIFHIYEIFGFNRFRGWPSGGLVLRQVACFWSDVPIHTQRAKVEFKIVFISNSDSSMERITAFGILFVTVFFTILMTILNIWIVVYAWPFLTGDEIPVANNIAVL